MSVRTIAICAAAFFCLVGTNLRATPLATHTGDTDPETEGWTLDGANTGSLGIGPLAAPEPAWQINDNSATARAWYQYDVEGLEFLDARSGGWRLDGRINVLDTGSPSPDRTIQYVDEGGSGGGELRYAINLGADVGGAQAAIVTNTGANGPTQNVGSDGFHDYGLVFSPATQLATLYINGVSTGQTTSGEPLNIATFTNTFARFGALSTDTTGNASYAHAEISTTSASPLLAAYDMSGGSPASIDVDGKSSAMPLTVGNPGSNTQFNFSATTNTAYGRADQTTNTAQGAIDNGDYFSFTVTPDAGKRLFLESLFADVGEGSSNTSSITANWFVRSSLDNFADDLGTAAITVNSADNEYVPLLIDLTSPEFQALTDPVEFRFYAYDSTNSAAKYVRLDNVVLRGFAASVPEPTSLAICLLLGACVSRFRRRRR